MQLIQQKYRLHHDQTECFSALLEQLVLLVLEPNRFSFLPQIVVPLQPDHLGLARLHFQTPV